MHGVYSGIKMKDEYQLLDYKEYYCVVCGMWYNLPFQECVRCHCTNSCHEGDF